MSVMIIICPTDLSFEIQSVCMPVCVCLNWMLLVGGFIWNNLSSPADIGTV